MLIMIETWSDLVYHVFKVLSNIMVPIDLGPLFKDPP